MPAFTYVGRSPEHIVGIPEGDISEEQYEALDWDHQQAVYLNRGSDGGPLYQEVSEAPATAEEDEPLAVIAAPEPDLVPSIIVDTPAEPDLSQPLDQPAEGAN